MKTESATRNSSSIGYSRAIKAVRVFHRISQKDLAKELALPTSYISEIENGKRTVTLKLVEKYATYFSMNPSEILYLGENYDNDSIRKNRIGSKVLKVLDWIIDDHVAVRSDVSEPIRDNETHNCTSYFGRNTVMNSS